jgi:hypothetical protein
MTLRSDDPLGRLSGGRRLRVDGGRTRTGRRQADEHPPRWQVARSDVSLVLTAVFAAVPVARGTEMIVTSEVPASHWKTKCLNHSPRTSSNARTGR